MGFDQQLISAYRSEQLKRIINPIRPQIFIQILWNTNQFNKKLLGSHVSDIDASPGQKLIWARGR